MEKKIIDINWNSWLILKNYAQEPSFCYPYIFWYHSSCPWRQRWIHDPTWAATGPITVSNFPGHNDYPRWVYMIQDRPNKIILGIFSADTRSDLFLFDHRELSMWVQMCHSYVPAKPKKSMFSKRKLSQHKKQSCWCGVWF